MKNDNVDNDRPVHKTDPSAVKVGDIMAFTYFVKVHSVRNSPLVIGVDNLDGAMGSIDIQGKELVESGLSADQFNEELTVSKTRAAEILVSSHNRPFTVSFQKEDGTERILRGRLIKAEHLLGRSMVEDLEKDEKNRVRLVDHRTLNWIVVEGTKYIVK